MSRVVRSVVVGAVVVGADDIASAIIDTVNDNTKISKVIKNCFENQLDWYLFRYELMKVIHKQESTIRSDVKKNQQYFAYLLKTQLSTFEFNQLIEREEVANGVSLFRNSLILSTLKTDIFESLLTDINLSIKITSKRTYSS